MKKIIFLNGYYPPDTSATSELLASLTSDLAEEAHDIHVIASRQQNSNNEIRLPTQEVINGVTVHRVWTSNFGRKRPPRRKDIDVAKVDPFSCPLSTWLSSSWKPYRKWVA